MNYQKFWDKQAKGYDYSERQFDPVFKDVVAKTKLYLTKNDIALDFGCATGTKTVEFSNCVSQMHGLDISPKMIEFAQQKAEELNLTNVQFFQGDIFDTTFQSNTYNAIVSYGVAHLLTDSESVIKRLYDLLEPRGYFIVSTACLKGKMALKNKIEFYAYLAIKKLGIFPLHLNMYHPQDVEEIVAKQGFTIVKAETIFHGITISLIIAQK